MKVWNDADNTVITDDNELKARLTKYYRNKKKHYGKENSDRIFSIQKIQSFENKIKLEYHSILLKHGLVYPSKYVCDDKKRYLIWLSYRHQCLIWICHCLTIC